MSAASDGDWLDTPALCQALGISRSTLIRWRRRGLLSPGHHWVRKNPACPRSDLLWHRHRCSALLRYKPNPACRTMPEPAPRFTPPAPQKRRSSAPTTTCKTLDSALGSFPPNI